MPLRNFLKDINNRETQFTGRITMAEKDRPYFCSNLVFDVDSLISSALRPLLRPVFCSSFVLDDCLLSPSV
ncbi:hypothetical protein Q1695_001263 [Nippostrongylus brasiliensis]|nr:hypothetical protein Q1695_001263 [Nippostrongylus brasiliensis]